MTINGAIRRIENNVDLLMAELVDKAVRLDGESSVPSILLHYWRPQRAVVETYFPRTALRAISDPLHMRGIKGGTFVRVCGHTKKVPTDIFETIRMYGWTVIMIDDSGARSREMNL